MRRRGPDAAEDRTETGFLDVAANALGVVVLATLLILIVSAPPLPPGQVPREEDAPEIAFPPTPHPAQRPFVGWYWIGAEGVAEIDFDALAVAAADGGRGRTDDGQLRITTERTARRDWNAFRGGFGPDPAALRRKAREAEVDVETLVASLAERAAEENVSPLLLVSPDGAALAAEIYWGLRAAGAPVRWSPIKPGADVTLSHRATDFERVGGYDG